MSETSAYLWCVNVNRNKLIQHREEHEGCTHTIRFYTQYRLEFAIRHCIRAYEDAFKNILNIRWPLSLQFLNYTPDENIGKFVSGIESSATKLYTSQLNFQASLSQSFLIHRVENLWNHPRLFRRPSVFICWNRTRTISAGILPEMWWSKSRCQRYKERERITCAHVPTVISSPRAVIMHTQWVLNLDELNYYWSSSDAIIGILPRLITESTVRVSDHNPGYLSAGWTHTRARARDTSSNSQTRGSAFICAACFRHANSADYVTGCNRCETRCVTIILICAGHAVYGYRRLLAPTMNERLSLLLLSVPLLSLRLSVRFSTESLFNGKVTSSYALRINEKSLKKRLCSRSENYF